MTATGSTTWNDRYGNAGKSRLRELPRRSLVTRAHKVGTAMVNPSNAPSAEARLEWGAAPSSQTTTALLRSQAAISVPRLCLFKSPWCPPALRGQPTSADVHDMQLKHTEVQPGCRRPRPPRPAPASGRFQYSEGNRMQELSRCPVASLTASVMTYSRMPST